MDYSRVPSLFQCKREGGSVSWCSERDYLMTFTVLMVEKNEIDIESFVDIVVCILPCFLN